MNIEEMWKYYERLIETSNEHHNATYDYIYKYGLDDKVRVALQGKMLWIQKILRDN